MQNIKILPRPFRYDFRGHTKIGFGYCLNWLYEHEDEVESYLEETWDFEDKDMLWSYFIENPKIAYNLINDNYLRNSDKIKIILNEFSLGKSKIAMFIGARGSGKTATGFWLAEKLHLRFPQLKIYSCSPHLIEGLPKWCNYETDLNKVPFGALALTDEAAVQYNAREFKEKSHILLTKLLATARHRNQSLFYFCQHVKLQEINITRLSDIIFWKKQNTYLSDIDNRARFFNELRRNMLPIGRKENTLFEYPQQRRFIHFQHKLPICWSNNLSKSWALLLQEKKDKSIEKQSKQSKEVYIIKRKI